ncbi:MAG: hypothetical protein HC886_01275 [Leptolyngbyaceae cyanobacterium SM1_1_3]|nr:hypothetical protein [Leptolyngbyaceae cyanobacterium SM1_1_3]
MRWSSGLTQLPRDCMGRLDQRYLTVRALDRPQPQINQNLNLYRVPADLENLFSILVAILANGS